MGANAELLNAAYHTHVVYQKPAFPPPDEEEMKRIQEARKAIINESNWKEHLGDERSADASPLTSLFPSLPLRTGTIKHT